jgi:hypothetical protein
LQTVEPGFNNKKKGSNVSNKNPLTNSMAHGNQFPNKSNPGTSQLDQRGAKIFEIYSSGKSGNFVGQPQGNGSSQIGSNVSTGSGGHSGITNSTVHQLS